MTSSDTVPATGRQRACAAAKLGGTVLGILAGVGIAGSAVVGAFAFLPGAGSALAVALGTCVLSQEGRLGMRGSISASVLGNLAVLAAILGWAPPLEGGTTALNVAGLVGGTAASLATYPLVCSAAWAWKGRSVRGSLWALALASCVAASAWTGALTAAAAIALLLSALPWSPAMVAQWRDATHPGSDPAAPPSTGERAGAILLMAAGLAATGFLPRLLGFAPEEQAALVSVPPLVLILALVLACAAAPVGGLLSLGYRSFLAGCSRPGA